MQNNQRIHIIHTNDLHSRFENMPKISTYIKKLRKESSRTGDKVIVVDLGDHMDRVQLETEGTEGLINVEILNGLEAEVITIGNNEGLTFTKEMLGRAYSNKKFKVVVCNLKEAETCLLPNWLNEYWIQEIEGIRIGWIGVTAPYETFYDMQGWKIEDPKAKIPQILDKIESEVDIILLLSHLGLKADEKIAEAFPGIDAILGGHTHHVLYEGIKKNGQPIICQAGIFGEYIGHLTIEYNPANRKIESINEKLINANDLEIDFSIKKIIKEYREIAKTNLSKPIVYLEQSLPMSLEKESPLGNLLADGIRKWVNAEIAFVNNGQLLNSLDKGKITKEMVHKICPSPINTCSLILTGREIKFTLEEALLDEYIYYPFKGFGFRGQKLGTLSISGLNIIYDPLKHPYQKITEILINNLPLENEKSYKVGTIDMFTFGGGYSRVKEGRNIQYFLPEFLRNILENQLLDKNSIKQSFSKRWIQKINKTESV